jgi:hypothetical protein
VINIVLWKWDQPNHARTYTADHVNVMCSMLRRNLDKTPHRIICITDKQAGISECECVPLWHDCEDMPNATKRNLPSCYRRLKLYDRATQRDVLDIERGERIMSIDLDAIVTGDLRALIATEGRYVGWHLPGTNHPVVFNGSLQMFSAGDLQEIWSEFDPASSPKAALHAGYLGSDQAWLSFKLIDKEGSVGLTQPLVTSFPLQNRIQQNLDARTRLIFFHGSIKPWDREATQSGTSWVSRYWRH